MLLTLTGDVEAMIHAICHVNINGPWWHVHWYIARCNSVLISLRSFINCTQICLSLYNPAFENGPIVEVSYKYFTYKENKRFIL